MNPLMPLGMAFASVCGETILLGFGEYPRLGMAFASVFWHDNWCGDSALKCYFHKFITLARNKEALVSEYMDHSNPHTLWNPNFMRDVYD
jgi:hypothetical protein